MNIVFMGTPDFAKDSLEALVEKGYNISLVLTNPDKPKGRGMKLTPSPVKEYALSKNIKVLQPQKIKKNEEIITILKALNPDFICVVAYGKILPKEILEIPKYHCINVHGSILPKYRGAAPIQWSILNGDKETGITTMEMAEGMDTGDIFLTEKVQIDKYETTGELWNRLSKIGAKLLIKTIEGIQENKINKIKQSEDFTMAPMLTKTMAKIDWEDKNVNEINNLVRGLNPIMGAYTYWNNKKIKIWRVNIFQENEIPDIINYSTNIKNGTVIYSSLKDGLYVKAKDGIVSIIEIQGENSKKMNILEFLKGNKIEIQEIFS